MQCLPTDCTIPANTIIQASDCFAAHYYSTRELDFRFMRRWKMEECRSARPRVSGPVRPSGGSMKMSRLCLVLVALVLGTSAVGCKGKKEVLVINADQSDPAPRQALEGLV